jgi:hypothetical protein
MNHWDKALEQRNYITSLPEANITSYDEFARALGTSIGGLGYLVSSAFGVTGIVTMAGYEGWRVGSDGRTIIGHKMLNFPFLLSEFKSVLRDIQADGNTWEMENRVVASHQELAEALGTDVAHLGKVIYKGTDCGAYLVAAQGSNQDHIKVGSIVEGTDQGTEEFTLVYPFKVGDLWYALGQVEEQALEIWNSTHGCPDCFNEPGEEFMAGHIDPHCPTCEGLGDVL